MPLAKNIHKERFSLKELPFDFVQSFEELAKTLAKMKLIIAFLVISVVVATVNAELMQRFSARKCDNKPRCEKGQKVKSFVTDGTTCPEDLPVEARGNQRQRVCQNVSNFERS